MSRTRRGVSLAELLVAVAVLAMGAVPAFQMLQGARGMLAHSQEALRMQVLAGQIFEDARIRVVRGEFSGLLGPEELRVETREQDLVGTVSVQRHPESMAFELVVSVEGARHRFAFRALVADPLAATGAAPPARGAEFDPAEGFEEDHP